MQLSKLCEIVEKSGLKRAIITIDTNQDNVSVIVNIPTATVAKVVKASKLSAALSTPLVINGNIAEIDVTFDEKLQEYGDAFAPAAISYNQLNSNCSTAAKALKKATPAKQAKTPKKAATKSKKESAKTTEKNLFDSTPEVKTPAFETTQAVKDKAPAPEANTAPAVKEKAPTPEANTAPAVKEKAPAPEANTAPAVEEKAPTPEANTAPAVKEKAPAPEANTAPAVEEKAPAPEANTAPAVEEETPAPEANTAPAVEEETPVVDDKTNDPQLTLEQQQSEMMGFFNFNF